MATSQENVEKSDTTRFLEAAKDFSFDQKLSVIQSILAKIPREQQQPWNAPQQLLKQEHTVAEDNHHVVDGGRLSSSSSMPPSSCASSASYKKISEKGDGDTIKVDQKASSSLEATDANHVFQETGGGNEPKPQAPPLIDPYEKSMRYYEKHLVLNNFQHMTAKLVLQRPENTLQFMIDWCKDMQQKQEETRLKSKTLYEGNKIDVYEDGDEKASAQPMSARTSRKSRTSKTTFGTSNLKEITNPETDQRNSVGELPNKVSGLSTDSGVDALSGKHAHRDNLISSTAAHSDDELSPATDDGDSISVSSASETL